MAVPGFLNSIETSAMSTWIRQTESIFGFYFILLCHNFGLALLVGSSVVIDLRILGVAPDVPLKSLKPLFKIMWIGLVVGTITGLLLLYSYPTKALTNPMFYLKLTLIGLGVWLMFKLKADIFDDVNLSESDMIAGGASIAKYSIALWIGAITAGRLLAYTYTYLYYGTKGAIFFNLFNSLKFLR